MMNRFGYHFFAGAAFTCDQNGNIRRRNLPDYIEYFFYLNRISDNSILLLDLIERLIPLENHRIKFIFFFNFTHHAPRIFNSFKTSDPYKIKISSIPNFVRYFNRVT